MNNLKEKILTELGKLNKTRRTPFFYWTKKDEHQITQIIDSLGKEDVAILDPFLGSGATLFGAINSRASFNFYGAEINQMPVEQINFRLNANSEVLERNTKIISNLKKSFGHLYEYEIKGKKHIIEKIIFDQIESGIKLKKIYLKADGNKIILDKHSKEFSEVSTKLHKKISKLKKENKLDLRLKENSRIAIKKDMMLSSIFTPINFFLLCQIKKGYKNEKQFMVLLSSIIHLCKVTDLKSQSQFPYWVPKKDCIDRNIFFLLEKKNLELVEEVNQKSLMQKKTSINLFNKPIQNIAEDEIPDKSIDLLLTDPPYFDQVAYSEYLEIWKFFTDFKTNLDDEVIQTNQKESPKDREIYLSKLSDCFRIISKKMKNNGIAIIYFKDTNLINIFDFLDVLNKYGLVLTDQAHLPKSKFTYKQNTTQKTTVEGDSIFLFQQDKPADIKCNQVDTSYALSVITKYIDNYLIKHNVASLSEIYDSGLIKYLYMNGIRPKKMNSNMIIKEIEDKFKVTGRNIERKN